MPSLKSQLLFFTMRNSHLLKFRLKREAWDWNTSVPQFRQDCEDGAARFGKLPEGIEVKPALIEGLPQGLAAEWILPAGSESGKTIFYVHGGGYISGSCSDHCSRIQPIVSKPSPLRKKTVWPCSHPPIPSSLRLLRNRQRLL